MRTGEYCSQRSRRARPWSWAWCARSGRLPASLFCTRESQLVDRETGKDEERTLQLPDVHEVLLRGELIDRCQYGRRIVAEAGEFFRREEEDVL